MTHPLSDDRQFNLNWPHGHVTRDGRKARIICTDRAVRNFPIVALILDGGIELAANYTALGYCLDTAACDVRDLCNVPAPKRTVWVKIYGPDYMNNFSASRTCFNTEAEAKDGADTMPFSTYPIEIKKK